MKNKIIKVSKGVILITSNKDTTFTSKNVNTSAGINVHEKGEQGVSFGHN